MNDASLTELLDEAYCCAMGGELDRATEAVAAARRWPALRDGSLESMDVMLVEGVVHTYRGETDAARDRLRRVIALASLLPQSEAPLQAWAWLALLDYNQGEVLSAADALAKACAQPERAGPRTRMRASVNAALLCEYAGLAGPARAWVAVARWVAPQCRVPGIMSLLVYGIGAARVMEASIADLRSAIPPSTADELLLQVQSAIHYDAAAGVTTQPTLHLLAHATALRLAKRPAEAIPLLERFLLEDALSAETDRLSARLELLTCQVQCNVELNLQHAVSWLECSVLQFVDPGERAHALLLLNELWTRAGLPHTDQWLDRAGIELAHHDADRSALAQRLATLGLIAAPPAWALPGTPTTTR